MIYNQIIEDDTIVEDVSGSKTKVNKKIIYKFFVVLVMAAVLSPISLAKGVVPIGYAMLGVASAFNVPLLLVVVVSTMSMFIFGLSENIIFSYLAFFVAFVLATSILNINGLSKRYAILIKLIISLLVVKLVQVIFMAYSFTEMLSYLLTMIAVYLVFVHGTSVIINIRKGYVFSNEEKISAICILSFLLTIFSNVNIEGISFSNIIAIMIVLNYGYKHGAILGCTTGFVVGLIMCLATGLNISFLVTLGAGGLVAGIMNKIGKPATVIGFIAGSAVVSYFSSDFAYYTASIIEIVIASLPVLVMPKKVIKKVEEFFNINNSLDVPYSNLLDSSKETEDKLNAISSVLSEIADNEITYTKEDKIEFREILKKYVMDYLEDTNLGILPIKKEIDKEKLDLCIDYISTKLESGDQITEDMIMFECSNKSQMINNLKDIYNSIKIMRILKKKEMQMHQKCNNEYKEISNIISNMASGVSKKVPAVNAKSVKSIRDELRLAGYPIYEDDFIIDNEYVEYTFITDILVDIDRQKKEIIEAVSNITGKNMTIRLLLNISKTEKSKIKLASITEYIVDTSMSQKAKDSCNVNGDSHLCMNFGKNKYISILSDGAGSGEVAQNSSRMVINTLEKLIKAGFEEMKASEIVNKIIKLRQDESNFASLDMALFDLETADSSFIKFGAAPTYILSDGKVTSINSMNIPVGLISDAEYIPIVKKLNNNDIVLQISDGALLGANNVHENYLTDVFSKINSNLSTKQIADKLLNELSNKCDGNILDDITIVVSKVTATKSIK